MHRMGITRRQPMEYFGYRSEVAHIS
jgi:hypothetical protein